MKKYIISFIIIGLFFPSLIFSDTITFKFGEFFPRTNSDLWETEFDNMDFTKGDFVSTILGFEYEYNLTRNLSFAFEISSYSRNVSGFYKDWLNIDDFAYPAGVNEIIDNYGIPISHVFGVSITPIQISFRVSPMGRKARIMPYFGAGLGVYFWRCKLQGETPLFDYEHEWYDTDFDVYVYEIWYSDIRDENNISLGFHGMAGLMIPFGERLVLIGEFKYSSAKGELEEFLDFEDFDLTSYQISLGIAYRL
ncbi:MAG: hypothetical protein ACE5WD_02160 [Candidatus Aminicenantia bacterium]